MNPGRFTFSSLNPNSSYSFENVNSNLEVVYAYDTKPSTGVYPWSLFSSQIAGASMSNLTGRMAAVASESGGSWQVTLFTYDEDGRVDKRYTYTHATGGTVVATALNTTIDYTLNRQGAPTQTVLTVGSQTFRHWYDYDGQGLLWKVFASTSGTKPDTADVTYVYEPDGQVDSLRFLSHVSVPFTYEVTGQLKAIGNVASANYPLSVAYSYDANGTVNDTEYRNGTSSTRRKYEFSYDALNRLTAADHYRLSGSWTNENANDEKSIGYDKSGNITDLLRYDSSGNLVDNVTFAFQSGTNRIASVSDAVSTTSATWDLEDGSFTYYEDGNLKTAPAPYSITAATYNSQNLPESITAGGVTSSYRYNDAGQRIAKKVGSGNVEYYARDGATTLGVFTLNGSGSPTSWHFNILAGGAPVGRHTNGGSRFYYHTDMLGSTRAVVNSSGPVTEAYNYYPFGLLNEGLSYSPGGTDEQFTGKERDGETGMSYFGARYYMPALGRWAAVDPLADGYAGWSPYNYVLGNPGSNIDPDGQVVRCTEKSDCELAVELINKLFRESGAWEDDVGLTVVESEWEVTTGSWFNKKTETVQGWALSTEDSDYDFGQDPLTSGLYDVINTDEYAFQLSYGGPDEVVPGTGLGSSASPATLGRLQGFTYPNGRVVVGTVNNRGEPPGIVTLHELIGHGHPNGGRDAYRNVNQRFPEMTKMWGPHSGHYSGFRWKLTGLYYWEQWMRRR